VVAAGGRGPDVIGAEALQGAGVVDWPTLEEDDGRATGAGVPDL